MTHDDTKNPFSAIIYPDEATALARSFLVAVFPSDVWACCRFWRNLNGCDDSPAGYLDGCHFAEFRREVLGLPEHAEMPEDFGGHLDTLRDLAWTFLQQTER